MTMNGGRLDEAGFMSLYDDQSARLLAFFVRRVYDPETAADLAAETFATAFEQRSRFDPTKGDDVGWLFGIGRNLLQHYFRRQSVETRARRRLGIERPALSSEDVDWLEEQLEKGGQYVALAHMVDGLGRRQQDILRLRFFEEWSYRRIAEELECSEPSCRTAASRALKLLALNMPNERLEGHDRDIS